MKLEPHHIAAQLTQLQGWQCLGPEGPLEKSWTFNSFSAAMAFFVAVGDLAERLDHHPELLSSYTYVRIRLWTHDVQGLTALDFDMALAIDQLDVLSHQAMGSPL
jgi:4a-hydroxytetrahydrobiopterin dehydratase